ncbi:hypothetical protein BgiBS90_015505 [Biomphalaria glabrata]|nr:hypothetical protein BgiBS90_015505 [Biomphalaria glabrata]
MKLIFIYLLAGFFFLEMLAGHDIGKCLPAQDGQSYQVTCGSGNHKYPTKWTLKLPKENIQLINESCNELDCARAWAGRISITALNETGESRFELSNVTIQDHGAEIGCLTRDEAGVETVSTCVLQVYHKPDVYVCNVNKTGDNVVFMKCSTPKVFPDLNCSFAQFESGTRRVDIIAAENIHYVTEKAEEGYYRSSCSTTITSMEPGIYEFFPVLQASNSKPVKSSAVPAKPLTPVAILSSPRQLYIYRDFLHPNSEDCPVQSPNHLFICEARGFTGQTTLELIIGDTPALPLTSIVTGTTDGNIYRTIFKPDPSKAADLHSHITCFAKTSEQLTSKQVKVEELEEAHSSHAMFFSSDAENKLTCHGQNLSSGAMIQVTCFKDNVIMFTSNSHGENAEVNLHIGFHKATCVCLSKDEKQCFQHKTLFQVSETTQSDSKKTSENFIIVLTCLIFVFILLITAILFYFTYRLKCKANGKQIQSIYSDYKQVPSDLVNDKIV